MQRLEVFHWDVSGQTLPSPQAAIFRWAFSFRVKWSKRDFRLGYVTDMHSPRRPGATQCKDQARPSRNWTTRRAPGDAVLAIVQQVVPFKMQLANMTDGKDTLTYRFLCSFQPDTYKRCSVSIINKVQVTSCLKTENYFVEIQYLHDIA